ncbi:AAA family ATPase [Nocardiopsis flavescens]|uniref:AAA domain (Dynein-related subfamily) n=1 Tax=Nocardiopsis flavescens TaxID=758803 RepID=A0A1M6ICH4_9ACTN|nr:AAA family ATPase [Nocardiopsis flavescens]SHJ32141.1 AAA domain (dynein-related subfamily) [Nocardiopsis flavescens]
MVSTGDAGSGPRLVVLRGNSGSGKSTVAATVRAAYGRRGMAVVGQDVVRRDILRERDRPGAVNIGLIDLMVRHILGRGAHVVLEGIFYADHYGPMLTALIDDHPGRAHAYYFDLPFEVTLARHATKPLARELGEAELRRWWRPRDLLPGAAERTIDRHASAADTAARILRDCGLSATAAGG